MLTSLEQREGGGGKARRCVDLTCWANLLDKLDIKLMSASVSATWGVPLNFVPSLS